MSARYAQGREADGDWTAPGPHPVAPGVYRIPLPMPSDGLRAVNVYAIESGDSVVMVDAGWAMAQARDALGSALRRLGRGLGDISRFLVTHVHRDHYTQAVVLRREFGSRVGLGLGELPTFAAMERPGWRPEHAQLSQLRDAGAHPLVDRLLRGGYSPQFEIDEWERPDEWLHDGAVISLEGRQLTVHATPGHTTGHIVFVSERESLFFAGDHVLPHITPSIGYEAVSGALPLGSYLGSLASVRAMDDMVLLPAHGPAGGSTHRRIDELLAHHDARLVACMDAVEGGAQTAYETARVLPWTRRERRFDDLDLFNQMLATTETIAHLELLRSRGDLESQVVDGVVAYRPVTPPAHDG